MPLQDLDNERFIINNGAHYALERMPHIDWMAALQRSGSDNRFVLPGVVPDEAVVDLLTETAKRTSGEIQLPQISGGVADKVWNIFMSKSWFS